MKPEKLTIFSLLFFIIPFLSFAQEEEKIEKRVQVVKAYKPKVEKAYKITELPEITDTTTVETEINYYLLPKRVETDIDVKPIPAATMVGEPLTELYSRYLKMGMGSKLTPEVEFYIMTKRSEERSIGASVQHSSSGGKVPLRNNDRVFAGYSDSKLKFYGKQIFKNSALDIDLGLKNNTRYFYGYNARAFGEEEIALDKENIKQNFLRFGADANYKTTYTDSLHFNYDIDVDFRHIQDNYNTAEDQITVDGKFNKFIENNNVSLNTGFTYLNHETPLDTGSNTLFHFNPLMSKFGEGWKIKGGVNFMVDAVNGNAKLRIFPLASMEYDIINSYIIPYAGIDGKIDLNSYNHITGKNPFVLPGLKVQNTNHNLIFYGGVKGNLSSSTYYNTRFKYSVFENMHFFVNHFTDADTLGNRFDVLYDNGEYLNLFGEISFEFPNDIVFRASGNLYRYTLNNLEYAWHKPAYDLTLSVRYDLRDKIILESDVFISGKRWVQSGANDIPRELDGYVDLNMGLEYRYSKVLSAYLKLNNILSDNYNVYDQYPVYGLQAFLGVTYAF